MTRQALRDARWDIPRAEAYMQTLGVLKGCNYVPAYCHSYIQMWQDYREQEIMRELTYARQMDINTLRIFVGTCQWQTHKERVYGNLDAFLTLTKKMGFSIMLTLQPNHYMVPGYVQRQEDPFLIHFIPGRHDKGWTYEGSVFGPRHWPESKAAVAAFVTDIVTRYAQDDRVAIWDLYNEPWADCNDIVETVFAMARAVRPRQPLTSCWESFDISDVTSFHCYERPGMPYFEPGTRGKNWLTFEAELQRAIDTGRPMVCTECLARTFGNELADFLPVFARHDIGFYVWGLCAGSAQYHFPWDWPVGSPEPRRWFHCLLYPDGAAFDETELRLIRDFAYERK